MAIKNTYKREVKEIVTIAKLETQIKIIIVEGPSDYSLFKRIHMYYNNWNLFIYEIETINIPSEIVKDKGFENNNRGRLLALSTLIDDNIDSIRIIVDKDFHPIIKDKLQNKSIFYTDFANMEMYLLNEEILEKFSINCLFSFHCAIDKFINNITAILKKLYLIRIVFEICNWEFKCLKLSKHCQMKDNNICFDFNKYLINLLSSCQIINEIDKFNKVHDEVSLKLSKNILNCIHGHDFINLITIYYNKNINKKSGKKRNNADRKRIRSMNDFHIERALYSCLDILHLMKFNLFQKIKYWIEN